MSIPLQSTFGTATSLTCTLTGLSVGGARESNVVNNTSGLYLNYAIVLTVVYPNAAATGVVSVFMAPSLDGTNFAGNGTGTDSAYVDHTGGNYYGLDDMGLYVFPVQNGTSSRARSFGNLEWVPPYFTLVAVNNTSQVLSAGSAFQFLPIGVEAA